MPKYRKRPLLVEAIQWTGDNLAEVKAFLGDAFICPGPDKWPPHGAIVTIRTKEGDMVASRWDFIIKGVKGEKYSCKPDIFEMTYEAVE